MYITKDDIKKLLYYPIDFALQMENYQIDYVLCKFLDVRNAKYKHKEDYLKSKWQKEYKALAP